MMNLFTKIRTQLRYYLVWRTSALFVSGLLFGHNIVEHAVVKITMAYLQFGVEGVKEASLRRSAIIVIAQQGLTSILALLMTFLSHTCGYFTTLSLFTIPYILGFVVLWLLNPGSSGQYFIAATLIAIGGSTKETCLRTFLYDQMRNNNLSSSNIDDDDEKLVESRTYIWWYTPRIIASIIASFVLSRLSWELNFLISAISLGCASLFFLSGFKFYRKTKTPMSATNPFEQIVGVIKAGIIKRNIPYSDDSHDYFRNGGDSQLPLTPDVFFSRWLDKAAIIDKTYLLSEEEQVKQGTLYTVAQVEEVKSLMKMVPLWAVLLQFSLVDATGNTFFYEQTTDLDYTIGNNFKIPFIFLNMSQSFSDFVTSRISNLIISKCFSVEKNKRYHLNALKARIGIGLACSSLCCFIARLVEIRRFKNYDTDQDGKFIGRTNMSVLWLVPEFCLLGISKGLVGEGIDDYLFCQTETLKDYVWAINEFVWGIGYFISIFWVLSFKKWIGISIYYCRFDRYFGVLAIVSLINLFIIFGFTYVTKYCCHGGSVTRANARRTS